MLLKISYQEIYRLVKPINIIDKNLFNSNVKIDDEDLKIAFLVFLSLIISIFVLSSILSFDYLNFEEAKKIVRNLKIKSVSPYKDQYLIKLKKCT